MDFIKQLTGKNPKEYEPAAVHIISNADVRVFEELVNKDDFLFDFIKSNVAKRLEKACNLGNYKNLLNFLSFYSSSYDDFIARVFDKFADDEVVNILSNKLLNGTEAEKAYCAKFFSYRKDSNMVDILIEFSNSEFDPLALNCALALSSMGDRKSVEIALDRLKSQDDFEVLSAVKFLSAYGEKNALSQIFEIMKKSSVSEYIACEIGYMESFLELLDSEFYEDTLLAVLQILQGLGEIVPLSSVFNFQLYEFFEKLIFTEPNSKNAVILLNAKNKFNQLTENDEYLFDEDNNTKTEVNEIKKLLNDNLDDDLDDDLDNFISPELSEDSNFVYFALDLVNNAELIRGLLNSTNQTLILKTLENLKSLNELSQKDKDTALANVSDENIKLIINAL